jgi:hypothetical protein
MTRALEIVALLLIACSIAACSGGGGGGNSSNPSSSSSSSGSSSTTPVTPTPNNSTSGGTTTPTTPTTKAHTLQLNWSVPTTRENGTALTTSELTGYQIYYYQDGASSDTGEVVPVAGGSTTSARVTVNGSGTYYFAIAAKDAAGLLSNLSNYVAVALN